MRQMSLNLHRGAGVTTVRETSFRRSPISFQNVATTVERFTANSDCQLISLNMRLPTWTVFCDKFASSCSHLSLLQFDTYSESAPAHRRKSQMYEAHLSSEHMSLFAPTSSIICSFFAIVARQSLQEVDPLGLYAHIAA